MTDKPPTYRQGLYDGLVRAANWHLDQHRKATNEAITAQAAGASETNVLVRLSHLTMADAALASATRHAIYYHELYKMAVPYKEEETKDGQ